MKQDQQLKRKTQSSSIDLGAFLLKVRSMWYLCIIGILVGALSGILYYSVFSIPKYESTAMVYLRSSNKKLSLESLQLTTNLTQDYQLMFVSRPNLQQVKSELHLNYSISQLKSMITIENPDETRILEITVKSKNAVEAKNIANSLMKAGMDDIREVDSQEPYVIENGIVSTQRVGLSFMKILLISSIIGLIIVIEGLLIKFVYNDSFVSSDDVEKTLGLPVLAVIAEDQSLTYAKLESSNSRRRKHHGKKTSK